MGIEREMAIHKIRTKRVYEPATDADGVRVLVDRLWPRGLTKDKARIDHWTRDIAPSNELRGWYGHDLAKWDEFQSRYFAELDESPEAVAALRGIVGRRRVTFLFSSREEGLNNAAALERYLAR